MTGLYFWSLRVLSKVIDAVPTLSSDDSRLAIADSERFVALRCRPNKELWEIGWLFQQLSLDDGAV